MDTKRSESLPVTQRIRRLKPLITLAVLLLIVGGTGFLVVRQLRNFAARIVEDTLPGLVYSGQINAELSENFVRTMMVISSESADERDLYLKRIEDGSQKVNGSMVAYKKTIFDDEEERAFDRLVSAREKYREIRQQAFDLVGGGKRTEAARLFETEVLPAYAVQKEAGETLFDYNVRQGSERGRYIETLCSRTEWVVAAICIGIFIGGFFTPFVAIRLPPDVWK
ncbi:MAG TPA: MCP four helix bundle domain-containing protein [Verrucomicrobiae bacterium]|nr:MCP four helix bundle domain-containing protein [Verrucomicrobiae bacterium]